VEKQKQNKPLLKMSLYPLENLVDKKVGEENLGKDQKFKKDFSPKQYLAYLSGLRLIF
jgi:hypothetical protein